MSEESMLRHKVRTLGREFEFEQMRKYVSNVVDAEVKDWPFFYGQNNEPYPWHFHLFRKYKIYRSRIGGLWQLHMVTDSGSTCWMRMKRSLPGAIAEESYR